MNTKARLMIAVGSFIAFLLIAGFSSNKIQSAPINDGRVFTRSINLPSQLEFLGEKVPLEFFDVKESLDREIQVNTYFQSQTIFFLKRANRYFPEIEKILKEEGVPVDFKYLAVAESGLTNAVSPSKAVGFWQFLSPTGKEYGLEINDEVDERFHLERSTRAACQYLKETYAEFGSWTLAAASYNMGRNALRKQIDLQKEKSYFDLQLNEETARYIFRIIAIKLVIEKPAQYGFQMDSTEMYQPFQYSEIKVDYEIPDLVDFAKKNNTSYKILKILNPWLRSTLLRANEGKCYSIKLPGKNFREARYQEDITAEVSQ